MPDGAINPDDAVVAAARNARSRRQAIGATAELLRRRLDPRLLAADVATRLWQASVVKVALLETAPKKRKRALVAAGVAAITAVTLRVLYRTDHHTDREKIDPAPSPEPTMGVKPAE